jgi:hypothetical protein
MNRFLASALLVLSLAPAASADLIESFEGVNTAPGGYYSPSASGPISIGGLSFSHQIDAYGNWYGWSFSSKADGSPSLVYDTNDYGQDLQYQYSSITGSGSGGSSTYAVAFTVGPVPGNGNPPRQDESILNLAPGTNPVSIDVTNTVYTYNVLAHGNSFAHAFSNANQDFLELTITGYTGLDGTGSAVGTPVTFYLADYTGTNSILVDTWHTLNLSSLAGARSLRFGLISSDVTIDPITGANYGTPDPAYFAADNLVTAPAAVPEPASLALLLGGLATSAALAARLRGLRPVIMRASDEGRDA